MVFYKQLEGNNVQVSGYDLAGEPKAPTYNSKMEFSSGELGRLSKDYLTVLSSKLGAQTDIFRSPGSASSTYIQPASTLTLSSGGRTTNMAIGGTLWVVSLSMSLGLARTWI